MSNSIDAKYPIDISRIEKNKQTSTLLCLFHPSFEKFQAGSFKLRQISKNNFDGWDTSLSHLSLKF